MKYQLYQRGNTYRIARPGRWFWHWYKRPLMGHYFLFTTTDRDDAFAKLVEANEELKYQEDRWRRID